MKRKYLPSVVPSETDIAWAAGFLEGEGTFRRNKQRPRIQAMQTNREPLERLQALFGGPINAEAGPRRLSDAHPSKLPTWSWCVTGDKAAEVMRELLPHMSTARQARIREALDPNSTRWRSSGGSGEE